MRSFVIMPTAAMTLVGTLVSGAVAAHAQPQPVRATPPVATTPPATPPVAPVDPTVTTDRESVEVRRLRELILPRQGGMTLEQVGVRAVRVSPVIERSRADAQRAAAEARRAWAAFLPTLTATARYTRLSAVDSGFATGTTPAIDPAEVGRLILGVDDAEAQRLFVINGEFLQSLSSAFSGLGSIGDTPLNQFALRGELQVPISDYFFAIAPGYEASLEAAEAARLQQRVRASSVALQAREAVLDVLLARGGLVVAQQAVEQLEAARNDLRAFVEVGTAPRIDLVRLEAQLAIARTGRSRTRTAVRLAQMALRTLLHMPLDREMVLDVNLEADVPVVTEQPEALVRRALRRRTEVRAVQTALRAQRRGRSARRAAGYPHLVAAAGVDVANPNQRVFPQQERFDVTWDASLIVTWTPNSTITAGRDLDVADAEIAQTQADLAALRDGIRLEVWSAWAALQDARATLVSATEGLAAAEEGMRVRAEQFRAGAAVARDLIDSQGDVTRARLEILTSRVALLRAHLRLTRATGE
ncbi:MAG: TolC family protein [Deltaproteobacteria bacterium]|nr:TolC family protein [Deltaproteobacteria bacterium]